MSNGTTSRRRTRSQWDEYYRNYCSDLKKNQRGARGEQVRNVVDSESIIVDGGGGNGWKRLDSAFVCEENIEQDRSSGKKDAKRNKNSVGADNVASVGGDLGGKEKLDLRAMNDGDGDGDVQYLGEEVVSNGSSVKTGPGSRSDSGSKVGNLDEVISCVITRDGSVSEVAEDGGSGGQCSRGGLQTKSLDGRHMSHDDVNLDSSTGLGDSSKNSSGSDDSSLSESESTSEEDNEFLDEDYKADELSSSSDDSEASYYVEQEKDDENDSLLQGKEVPSNITEDKKALCIHRKSKRMNEKKGSDTKQEDEESDECYNGDNDDGGRPYKRSCNQQRQEDVVIFVDDEEKFPSAWKSARICKKKENEVEHEKTGKFDEIYRVVHDSCGFNEPKSLGDECSYYIEKKLESGQKCLKQDVKLSKRKTCVARNLDLIKILVESINTLKDEQCHIHENAFTLETLPLKFRFEDEMQPPPHKSAWEEEMDSLFCDLELGLRGSEIECPGSPLIENDDCISTALDRSPAACCDRGEHEPILDEQIGIVCRYCTAVILDIKYVLPDFYTPRLGRRDRKDSDESPSSMISQIQFQDSACRTPGSFHCAKGTVWDLISGVEKEMYPHQREGFEFLWKNIAGDISIEKLKQPLSDGGRGCIISHAPGTGKTRLTIMFLLTFLKLYPTCCPVIIAPRGMLLTWESEFIKWHVNIPFHNLNKMELAGNENAVVANIMGQVGAAGLSRDSIRLLKLYSWIKGGSILGISYQLFEKLAGENVKGLTTQIRKMLLELPGLLVLDEGHTPRNDQSQIWKALTKVATQRRIILSGTPFQNNLSELYNTLCLVNPKFASQIGSEYNINCCETHEWQSNASRKRWTNLTSSIGKNKDDGITKIKRMLDPFVHVHKGTILEESLLGLRDTLVFLHPTEMQKTLLETACTVRQLFHRIRLVSLISVHPSLTLKMRRFTVHGSELEELESDINAGVKTKFVMKLIWLADALDERVLVFSQFIDPLVFIKRSIMSHFSWSEGREVLYMDGKLDEKQRQESISSFNDDASEAKVLLASERACSEGINLVGASRVVLLDTVWNPSVEKQAISRAYRLGQKKVVYVYRLFTSGTEVRQYAQQVQKERLSQLIFSPVHGQTSQTDKPPVVHEDKVLEEMLHHKSFSRSFEKIIHQPKESDLIENFGLVDQK